MSVCLNMIVRDEAAVIERCLASVLPYIDSWVIVDTGSLDDTPARIQRILAGVPGELHHRPWINFGHNRGEALELARGKADYLLFIDADETLGAHSGAHWPELSQDAYSLEARFNGTRYDRVGLVSTRLPWRWAGVLHEYLDAGQPVEQPRLPGFWIEVRNEGARSQDPQKYEKDAAVLEAALRQEPQNARYTFYLAQSYRDAGQQALARQWYEKRSAMGGWEEEVWYSLFQIARLTELLGEPKAQVMAAYLRAYAARPGRAETLVALARYLRLQGDHPPAYLYARQATELPLSTDRLFVESAAYTWACKDELALAAFYTGRTDEAARLWMNYCKAPTCRPTRSNGCETTWVTSLACRCPPRRLRGPPRPPPTRQPGTGPLSTPARYASPPGSAHSEATTVRATPSGARHCHRI